MWSMKEYLILKFTEIYAEFTGLSPSPTNGDPREILQEAS
jgi:hypothetical protein